MPKVATAQAFTAEERRSYIGGSEIAAIMGLSKFDTALDIYNRKLGLAPDFTGNAHTERGNRLEHIACELFTELTGQKLVRRNQAYTHPTYPFIVGHIDRMFVGQKRLAEVKCPSIAAFRKYQREGLPEAMVIQLQVYLGLTGCSSGTWLIFCADAWDLATFEIEFDETIYNAAINAAKEFWFNHIEPQIPPAFDREASDIEIAKVGGQDITVRDDEAFVGSVAKLREAAELRRDADDLYELAKAELIDRIEKTPGIYEGGGIRLYYTEQAGRKTLDKKAMEADGIDLAKYEKQGKSFVTFKTYQLNGGQ